MTATVDRVLSVPPPAFSAEEAAALARRTWGVDGVARPADSERDQTFLIDGDDPTVLKISNVAEDPARLDMELLASEHAVLVDPSLPIARQRPVPGAPMPGDPAAFRAAVEGPTGLHHARLFDRLPGRAGVRGATLTDAAVRGWGTAAARLGRALRGFTHPAAARVMLWDAQHALALRDLLDAIADADVRAVVERTLDRYEATVAPVWPSLRAQVVHTDLSADNVLVDEDGTVTGLIDFGDMTYTALVVDLASVLRSLVAGRAGDEVFRAARIALDGYERVTPLEPEERAILGELLGARACASLVVPAARARLYEDGDALMAGLRTDALDLLRLLDATGWDAVARQLGGREPGRSVSMAALADRRARLLGPAVAPLAYDEPLHLVRGEGVWLFDAEGRRYLDAYNNVPVVGHGHPRVTEAIARQARRLNTNLRYLHETALEVAERLTATTPGLDVVLFVNSGSEANDVAWRIATAATGRTGGVCTENAYHGITEAIAALSPENETAGREPSHVRRWRPPSTAGDGDRATDGFGAAIRWLDDAGHGLAAAILDGVLTSDGILGLDPGLAGQLVRATHDAGGLWIADEVQGGLGRTGAMWSYERLGIVPDIVTLGKPMGNGHPVAAVLTRRDLAARFAATTDFFSTFGGNPVAMAAALAVLDVIDDERIIDNAGATGAYLREGLRRASAGASVVREVRGLGLATGVEMQDRATAVLLVNELRRRGMLVGRTGLLGNVVKIRPPLVFGPSEADVLVREFARVVGRVDGARADGAEPLVEAGRETTQGAS